MPYLGGEREVEDGEKKEKEEEAATAAAAAADGDEAEEEEAPVMSRMWLCAMRGERGYGAANDSDDSGGDGDSALVTCGDREVKDGEKVDRPR
jgi:hypothetical protein